MQGVKKEAIISNACYKKEDVLDGEILKRLID